MISFYSKHKNLILSILIIILIGVFSYTYIQYSKTQNPKIIINLNWHVQENIDQYRKIQYIFGSGNPQEINISRIELENINK